MQCKMEIEGLLTVGENCGQLENSQEHWGKSKALGESFCFLLVPKFENGRGFLKTEVSISKQ